MNRTMLATAAAALLAAGVWHLPIAALRAAEPAAKPAAAPAVAAHTTAARPSAPETITFDEYRDFREHYVAQRQARLALQLAEPSLSPDETARLTRIKAYYDDLAAMPAAQRDKLFRARFDQIDTNHDGKLDNAERTAWRAKQRAYYSQLAGGRAESKTDQR